MPSVLDNAVKIRRNEKDQLEVVLPSGERIPRITKVELVSKPGSLTVAIVTMLVDTREIEQVATKKIQP